MSVAFAPLIAKRSGLLVKPTPKISQLKQMLADLSAENASYKKNTINLVDSTEEVGRANEALEKGIADARKLLEELNKQLAALNPVLAKSLRRRRLARRRLVKYRSHFTKGRRRKPATDVDRNQIAGEVEKYTGLIHDLEGGVESLKDKKGADEGMLQQLRKLGGLREDLSRMNEMLRNDADYYLDMVDFEKLNLDDDLKQDFKELQKKMKRGEKLKKALEELSDSSDELSDSFLDDLEEKLQKCDPLVDELDRDLGLAPNNNNTTTMSALTTGRLSELLSDKLLDLSSIEPSQSGDEDMSLSARVSILKDKVDKVERKVLIPALGEKTVFGIGLAGRRGLVGSGRPTPRGVFRLISREASKSELKDSSLSFSTAGISNREAMPPLKDSALTQSSASMQPSGDEKKSKSDAVRSRGTVSDANSDKGKSGPGSKSGKGKDGLKNASSDSDSMSEGLAGAGSRAGSGKKDSDGSVGPDGKKRRKHRSGAGSHSDAAGKSRSDGDADKSSSDVGDEGKRRKGGASHSSDKSRSDDEGSGAPGKKRGRGRDGVSGTGKHGSADSDLEPTGKRGVDDGRRKDKSGSDDENRRKRGSKNPSGKGSKPASDDLGSDDPEKKRRRKGRNGPSSSANPDGKQDSSDEGPDVAGKKRHRNRDGDAEGEGRSRSGKGGGSSDEGKSDDVSGPEGKKRKEGRGSASSDGDDVSGPDGKKRRKGHGSRSGDGDEISGPDGKKKRDGDGSGSSDAEGPDGKKRRKGQGSRSGDEVSGPDGKKRGKGAGSRSNDGEDGDASGPDGRKHRKGDGSHSSDGDDVSGPDGKKRRKGDGSRSSDTEDGEVSGPDGKKRRKGDGSRSSDTEDGEVSGPDGKKRRRGQASRSSDDDVSGPDGKKRRKSRVTGSGADKGSGDDDGPDGEKGAKDAARNRGIGAGSGKADPDFTSGRSKDERSPGKFVSDYGSENPAGLQSGKVRRFTGPISSAGVPDAEFASRSGNGSGDSENADIVTGKDERPSSVDRSQRSKGNDTSGPRSDDEGTGSRGGKRRKSRGANGTESSDSADPQGDGKGRRKHRGVDSEASEDDQGEGGPDGAKRRAPGGKGSRAHRDDDSDAEGVSAGKKRHRNRDGDAEGEGRSRSGKDGRSSDEGKSDDVSGPDGKKRRKGHGSRSGDGDDISGPDGKKRRGDNGSVSSDAEGDEVLGPDGRKRRRGHGSRSGDGDEISGPDGKKKRGGDGSGSSDAEGPDGKKRRKGQGSRSGDEVSGPDGKKRGKGAGSRSDDGEDGDASGPDGRKHRKGDGSHSSDGDNVSGPDGKKRRKGDGSRSSDAEDGEVSGPDGKKRHRRHGSRPGDDEASRPDGKKHRKGDASHSSDAEDNASGPDGKRRRKGRGADGEDNSESDDTPERASGKRRKPGGSNPNDANPKQETGRSGDSGQEEWPIEYDENSDIDRDLPVNALGERSSRVRKSSRRGLDSDEPIEDMEASSTASEAKPEKKKVRFEQRTSDPHGKNSRKGDTESEVVDLTEESSDFTIPKRKEPTKEEEESDQQSVMGLQAFLAGHQATPEEKAKIKKRKKDNTGGVKLESDAETITFSGRMRQVKVGSDDDEGAKERDEIEGVMGRLRGEGPLEGELSESLADSEMKSSQRQRLTSEGTSDQAQVMPVDSVCRHRHRNSRRKSSGADSKQGGSSTRGSPPGQNRRPSGISLTETKKASPGVSEAKSEEKLVVNDRKLPAAGQPVARSREWLLEKFGVGAFARRGGMDDKNVYPTEATRNIFISRETVDDEPVDEFAGEEGDRKPVSQTKWAYSLLQSAIARQLDRTRLQVAIAEAQFMLSQINDEITTLEDDILLAKFEQRGNVRKTDLALRVMSLYIPPSVSNSSRGKRASIAIQTLMKKVDLEEMKTSIDENNDFLSKQIENQQEKMIADTHLPLLEKALQEHRRKNDKLLIQLEKVERKLGLVSPTETKVTSKETRQRMRYERAMNEELEKSAELDDRINNQYKAVDDLKKRINDQRDLHKQLKAQIDEQRKAPIPNVRQLHETLQGYKSATNKNKERSQMLQLLADNYDERINELTSVSKEASDMEMTLVSMKSRVDSMKGMVSVDSESMTCLSEISDLEHTCSDLSLDYERLKTKQRGLVNQIKGYVAELIQYKLPVPENKCLDIKREPVVADVSDDVDDNDYSDQ